MPIYEYECEGCHAVFEVRQKLSDPPPSQHSCGSAQVRRILSATSFVLKGTGWYKTDYADKKPSAERAAGEAGDPKKEGAKEGNPEGKDQGSNKAPSSKEASSPSTPAPVAAAPTDAKRKER